LGETDAHLKGNNIAGKHAVVAGRKEGRKEGLSVVDPQRGAFSSDDKSRMDVMFMSIRRRANESTAVNISIDGTTMRVVRHS
jgi:hypothetical protein